MLLFPPQTKLPAAFIFLRLHAKNSHYGQTGNIGNYLFHFCAAHLHDNVSSLHYDVLITSMLSVQME